MLVISQPQDLTADLVVVHLHARQVAVVRLDIGDFPTVTTMTASLGRGTQGAWSGVVDTGHHLVSLGEVAAVYYRRPSPFRMPDLAGPELAWAVKEARHGFGGVLAALPCRWVNHPHHNAAATKPAQLAAAARCGLLVPATTITNHPGAARDFAAACPGGAVYKTLDGSPSDVGARAVYTQMVTPDDDFAGVTATAHLFQAYVPKAYEVRLTVVGERMFAARIDAGSQAARLDWRTDYDAITFTPIDTPDQVAAGVRALLSRLRLRYAALDFVVDHEGRWWFLEANPNGQFGFIEHATGQPIADAIAADLTETSHDQ